MAYAPLSYPGLRATDDPILRAMQAHVQRYWDRKGKPLTKGAATKLYVADSLADKDVPDALARGASAAAGYSENQIILNAASAGAFLQGARDGATRKQQRRNVRRLYATLAHEEGHVRGQDHADDGGVMSDGMSLKRSPADWRALMHELRAGGLISKPAKQQRSKPVPRRRKPAAGGHGAG